MKSGHMACLGEFGPSVATRSAGVAELTIVKAEAKAVIIVPCDAAPASQTLRGAAELAHYIRKMTSQTLPIVAEGRGTYRGRWSNNIEIRTLMELRPFSAENPAPKGSPEIHVGWTRRALKEVGEAKLADKDIDGFLVRCTPDAVFLVGKNDWGTAYACWEVLEKWGVRWFLPGDFGEEVPTLTTLALPLGEEIHEPAFGHRQYSGRPDCFGFNGPEDGRFWMDHNRERMRLYYHHNLAGVFPPAEWAEKYPDLYPIKNGQRYIPAPDEHNGWQPRLSHPQAVNIAMEYARGFFRENPAAASIAIGINDGAGYSEDELDQSVPGAKFAPVFYKFANALAERFDKEFPDKLIGFLYYGEVKSPPAGTKIHPRLIGFLVEGSWKVLEKGIEEYDRVLSARAAMSPVFGIYDWFYGHGIFVPRLYMSTVQQWMQHGYEKGARHLKAEAYWNPGLDGFKYWIYMKLMWDPNVDVQALQEEFVTRFFKEAADPMREYFKIAEEYSVNPVPWMMRGDGFPMWANFRFRQPEQFESFPPEAVERCAPLLEEAARLAGNSQDFLTQQRVEFFRVAFDVARAMTLRYHRGNQAIPLLEKPETLAEGMARLAEALKTDEIENLFKVRLQRQPGVVTSIYRERWCENTLRLPAAAYQAAAETVLHQAIAALRTKGGQRIECAAADRETAAALEAALADISDRTAADALRRSITPMTGRVAISERTAVPPKMDGKLDDPAWAKAAVIGQFGKAPDRSRPTFPTEVRLCHDSERLYLAFRCSHPDTSRLFTRTSRRDEKVWEEEGVGIFISKPGASPEERCQAHVSARGNIYDYYNGTARWNGDIQVGASVEADAYVVQFSIPLKAINIDPAKDRFLKVNFTRSGFEAASGEKGFSLREVSYWFPAREYTVEAKGRGLLVLNT